MDKASIKEKFITLRAQGMSFDRLSKELGKSKQTLINWSREFEEEIANLKAIELESLNEQFYLSKEAKIKALGGVLSRIKSVLDERDFSRLPSEPLLNLFLKYYEILEAEKIEPRFKNTQEVRANKKRKQELDLLSDIDPSKDESELKAV